MSARVTVTRKASADVDPGAVGDLWSAQPGKVNISPRTIYALWSSDDGGPWQFEHVRVSGLLRADGVLAGGVGHEFGDDVPNGSPLDEAPAWVRTWVDENAPAAPSRELSDTEYARAVELCRRTVDAAGSRDGGPTVAGSFLGELRELLGAAPAPRGEESGGEGE